MAESETPVRKVAWNEVLPWLILFRSVRIALMARVLVLGAAGLILTTLGWRGIAWLFENAGDVVVNRWAGANWLWNDAGFTINLGARSASEVAASASNDIARVPAEAWLYLTAPFRHMFDADLTPRGFLCMLLACVWELLVWAVVGGAIARIAALKYTRDEAPTFTAALRHAVTKLPSYGFGPLIALAGAAVFGVQLLVLGLIMNVSFLAVLAAAIWPFVLVLGLLMAILLLGALVGWPLMWATVAVEGTDAFDALSRSYAYTYQRPWRLLWYVTFSVFLAAVSMFVVKAFAISAVGLGHWSISWGLASEQRSQIFAPPTVDRNSAAPIASPPPLSEPIGGVNAPSTVANPPAERDWTLTTANRLINFWEFLWKSLAAGYQAAYIWVSAVGIYLLLRRDIDGAELDEVFVDQSDEHGIPALEEDPATGVPEVAPGRPAQPADPGAAAKAPPSMM
jgi:hypothetical protein